MNEPLDKIIPLPAANAGGGPGKPPAPPVASASPTGSPGNDPAQSSAAKSVPLFGGHRGGKARLDGFAPGSPQAKEADRIADRERKKAARAVAARMVEPPPLPSANTTTLGAEPPPANGVGVSPGSPLSSPGDSIPWDPEQLKPLFEEMIDGAEENRVLKFARLAKAAGLSASSVKEIADDAKYAKPLKSSMVFTAPRVTADAANAIGISGKYSNSAILVTAMVANYYQGKRLEAKLQKMAEDHAKTKTPATPAQQPL